MNKGFIILSLCVLWSACTVIERQEQDIIARVGDAELSRAQARAGIPEAVFRQDSLKAYNDYVNDWIRKQLIIQEAGRIDLMESPDMQARLGRAEEEVILSGFRDAVMASVEDIEVTEEEARAYYQQNRDKFLLDERYIRFRHMVTSSLSMAENAKRDLMRGYEWERVARAYSLYPELKIAEAARYWPASTALKEYSVLNRYLQIIGVTEISLIENINGQYHFVQLVDERAEGEHPDLDWLIEQIRDWLVLEKKRRAYNSYLNNLYLSAQANNEIEILNVLPGDTLNVVRTDTLNNITE